MVPASSLLYNKEFDWLLFLVLGRETLNPQNFLSDRGVFVTHELLGPVEARLGLVTRKTNYGVRG